MMGFGGMRLLIGVPVLCVFLGIMVLLREGSPRFGGSFPEKSWALQRVFISKPALSLQAVKTHLVVQLPGAREGFCHLYVVVGAQKEKPPLFYF